MFVNLVIRLCWCCVTISVDEDMFALPAGDDGDNDDDDIFTRPSGLFTSRTSNLFSDIDQVTQVRCHWLKHWDVIEIKKCPIYSSLACVPSIACEWFVWSLLLNEVWTNTSGHLLHTWRAAKCWQQCIVAGGRLWVNGWEDASISSVSNVWLRTCMIPDNTCIWLISPGPRRLFIVKS